MEPPQELPCNHWISNVMEPEKPSATDIPPKSSLWKWDANGNVRLDPTRKCAVPIDMHNPSRHFVDENAAEARAEESSERCCDGNTLERQRRRVEAFSCKDRPEPSQKM